jgi:hypothetical protein
MATNWGLARVYMTDRLRNLVTVSAHTCNCSESNPNETWGCRDCGLEDMYCPCEGTCTMVAEWPACGCAMLELCDTMCPEGGGLPEM